MTGYIYPGPGLYSKFFDYDLQPLLELVRERAPDLVVLDIRMPPSHTTEGLDAAQAIRAEFPEIGILLLSAHVEVHRALDLLAEGNGVGYLLKSRVTEADDFLETLERIAGEYDFILIDCPPSLSLLTVNAFAAAEQVLIPMQCEYYALEGLSDLVQTIRRVRAHLNPKLEIEGLLRTMYDPRNTLAQQVSAQLQQHFGDKVYRTVIPRNVRLAEAPSFGVSTLDFDRASKGAQAYLALAGEMLNRAAEGV